MRVSWISLSVFFCILVFLGLVGSSRMLGDSDTFWHIAVGRQILSTGTFPTVDEFTFTAAGQSWIANQWLAECLMSLVDSIAGWDGLVCLTASILSAWYAWLTVRFIKAGAHVLIAVLVLSLLFAASAYHLLARPHLVTLVLVSIVFGLLIEFESERLSLGWLWLLPPVFLIWGNLHGGVLGGLGTLWIVLFGWSLAWLLGWQSPLRSQTDVRHAIVVGIVCGVVLCLNPYGLRMFEAWRQILAMDLPHLVIEHERLDPFGAEGIMVVMVAVIYLVGVISATRTRFQLTWWIPAIWCVLALTRIRHGPIFATTAILSLADFSLRTPFVKPLASRDLWKFDVRPQTGSQMATCVAIAVPLVWFGAACWGQSYLRPVRGIALWAQPPAKIWPSDLEDKLNQLVDRSGDSPRVFNEQLFGGYLIYKFPNVRVFIDGRCELFGEPFLREYVEAEAEPSRTAQWLSKYDCDAALTRKNSAFDTYFRHHPEWRQVQAGRTAILHVRRAVWPDLARSDE